ncbi:MAG: hypothetical protein M1826_002044 [Phylliscum demangeonii]|nr:MAG: hypothetical protein M1826_002044 [Phylliscum demangeonii]
MPQLTPPSSETPSSRISQDGLEWEATLFGLKPRWTREPSLEVIESIAREHLSIPAADRCEIVFHAKGGFHKLFRVIPGGGVGSGYIMRVALPVDPHYKTSSEVATMEYIRSLTTIPIPKVVAHDSSNFNALGFEWILMEFMPGATLRERWKDLPMTTKECLVRQLARFQAQLFAEQHQEIGNVYRARCSTTQSPYYLGRIVTHGFFWGDHVHDTVPRGPFKDSHDWFSARLALKRLGLQRALESPDSDDDEREDASLGLSIVQKLLKLLPTVFPPDKPGPTFLFHDDLSLQNVLVDEHGVLTAVLDWECVSVLPLWCACKIPDLLRGGECDPPPPLDEVHHEPDGTVDSMYWDVLREFEKMKLRETFRDEMQRLCPEWVQVMDESGLQRDFDTAVTRLGEIWCKVINKWLETFENGNERWSLATSIETKFC